MLIDLEEVASDIASKVDGVRLTPVIEKEIIHYEIIRSLGRTACFEISPFKAGPRCVSAMDRNDIAKTSILSPATASIRSPWMIFPRLCAPIC